MSERSIKFTDRQLSAIVKSLGNALFGSHALDGGEFHKIMGIDRAEGVKLLSYINEELEPGNDLKPKNSAGDLAAEDRVVVRLNGVVEKDVIYKPRGAVDTGTGYSPTGGADVKVIKALGKMDLQRKINKLAAQGYLPQGGPSVLNRGKDMFMGLDMIEYTQVMVKG